MAPYYRTQKYHRYVTYEERKVLINRMIVSGIIAFSLLVLNTIIILYVDIDALLESSAHATELDILLSIIGLVDLSLFFYCLILFFDSIKTINFGVSHKVKSRAYADELSALTSIMPIPKNEDSVLSVYNSTKKMWLLPFSRTGKITFGFLVLFSILFAAFIVIYIFGASFLGWKYK